MSSKVRYPRRKGLRNKIPPRRLALLLSLCALLLVFFAPRLRLDDDRGQEAAQGHEDRAERNHEDKGEDQELDALDRLAASIFRNREQGGQSGAGAAPEERAGAGSSASTPRAAPGADPASGPGSGVGAPAQAAPFAGKSLEQIAAELTGRYAGRAPRLWGENMPGITSSLLHSGEAGAGLWQPVTLALTLDACAGKKGESFDRGLIDYLRREKIPATIFVTSLWIKNNADALRELAAEPLFEIASHGTAHKPASVNGRAVYGISGTASIAELVREVEGNVREIESLTGRRPRWYRSGTAYYDDVALSVIADLGLGVAGYSIAGDEGATLSSARVRAKTLEARHGDILLLHLNKPRSGTREGLIAALPLLKERGARFVRLSDRQK